MTETIYVAQLDEGVATWRPLEAEQVGESRYRLVDASVPETEIREFQPGTLVACKPRSLSGSVVLVAETSDK